MKQQIHGGDVYRHPGVIDFSSNMNPLGTPDCIRQALISSFEVIGHYPDIQCDALRDALSDYEGVKKEQIICGNGAAEVIFSLVQSLRPRKALLQAPTFAEYSQALETVDCKIDWYPSFEHGFRVEEDYLRLLTPELDIIFLCNPNNPTGFLIDPGLLEQIACRCKELDILMVVDECFQDFVPEEAMYSMKGLLEDYPLFLLKAFTKRYAMAGLRLGYGLCADREILQSMSTFTQPWNVSVPAQLAGVEALKETAYVKQGRELVQQELVFLKGELSTLGLRVYDSKSNYIFFEGPAGLKEQLLDKKLLIRSCANYHGLSEGYFRIAVRNHGDNEMLVRALKDILAE